jgi:phosphoribosylaminoimidazolecarboxamide formyltransferase/IMP cyclohydrolase
MPGCLISVSDKSGIAELARNLESRGFSIFSTGGTWKHLAEAGIQNLRKIEDYGGFPEIMDGRVKTLNPKVFGGILADRRKPEHLQEAEQHGIEMLDVVVCNLYPFRQVLANPSRSDEEIIENIDIGGVSLLRAAAKNFHSVWVLADAADYKRFPAVLDMPENEQLELKKMLAQKAFAHTASYDAAIAGYLSGEESPVWHFEKQYPLRYGENPHQAAAFYADPDFRGLSVARCEVLHGKELSYNNILDADAALRLIQEFSDPAAAVIKHNNPCGVAVSDDISKAFALAYEADAVSAFGGIVVLNRPCTTSIAEYVNSVFAELLIAPDFEPGSLEILQQKKNIRLLKTGTIPPLKAVPEKEYRSIRGGLLEQVSDISPLEENEFKVLSRRQPSADEQADLLFAFAVTRHIKSNTIVLAKQGQSIGLGGGQTSRIASVDIALRQAGEKAAGSVCASDGFFPFADGVEALAAAGITAIIQPGGSVRDAEVIETADRHGICMVMTGRRTFRH